MALKELKMLKTILLAATALIAAAGATGASAKTILFSSFDNVANAPSAGGFRIYTAGTVVDGWTAGANGLELQASAAGAPFSSPNHVELDTAANSSMFVNLGAGKYKVSYFYSPRPNRTASSNTITLSIGNTLLDTIGLVGGSTTAWTQRTVEFTSTTRGNLTFAAAGTSDGHGGYLDNITVSAVPEASTWAMLILGFGLAGYSLRRNNRAAIA
jgi:hypothetical protein